MTAPLIHESLAVTRGDRFVMVRQYLGVVGADAFDRLADLEGQLDLASGFCRMWFPGQPSSEFVLTEEGICVQLEPGNWVKLTVDAVGQLEDPRALFDLLSGAISERVTETKSDLAEERWRASVAIDFEVARKRTPEARRSGLEQFVLARFREEAGIEVELLIASNMRLSRIELWQHIGGGRSFARVDLLQHGIPFPLKSPC